MRREPAALIGSAVAAVEALFGMFVILGVFNLSGDQVVAIVAFAAALGAVVQAFWTRSQVTPVATAAAAVHEARLGGLTEFDALG